MTGTYHESNIDLTFTDDWLVMQYDASAWYRKQFQNCKESAAVDFIVVGRGSEADLWLLELKDFTTSAPDAKKAPLWQIVTSKVHDTLAGILAGAVNASEPKEREIFRRASGAKKIRVVFHCERPKHKSKLFKTLPDAADLRDKLRSSLRAVDTKTLVVDASTPSQGLPWKASWTPAP